jgi:hypothetical protein
MPAFYYFLGNAEPQHHLISYYKTLLSEVKKKSLNFRENGKSAVHR